jgi:hypothetical protein
MLFVNQFLSQPLVNQRCQVYLKSTSNAASTLPFLYACRDTNNAKRRIGGDYENTLTLTPRVTMRTEAEKKSSFWILPRDTRDDI